MDRPLEPDRTTADQPRGGERRLAAPEGSAAPPGRDPSRRPAGLTPYELGFTPRKPVPWLAPLLLLRTGLRSSLATTFGAYLDKRELQGALPARIYQQPGTGGELWLDFVADLGDGFDSTYSVAYLLGQPGLRAGDRQLPRGQALVMGGDLVYPTASMQGYEDRCKGPYTAALPAPAAGAPRPTLYTLPANHDWYDGLTAFLRLFIGERTDHIGAWCTEQSRSYFAVQLPQDWWVFAIDEAFGGYIDDPQLVYFEQAAEHLTPDCRVILVTPRPSWSKEDPKAYDTIDFFLRTIIAPTGARVPLMISGDQHYYARYESPERQLITCGGGGAYLSPTHTLPATLEVPPQQTIVRKASQSRRYALAACFPERDRSRRLGWGVFARLPWRNSSFVTLLGAVHALLMLAIAGAASNLSGTEEQLVTIPLVAMVLLVLAGAVGLAYIPTGPPKQARHFGAGTLHGVAHLGLAAAGAGLWLELPFAGWAWPLPLFVAMVLYLPLAGLLASQVVAVYLLLGSRFGINTNELFAGQGIEDYKSFLRLHVAPDGTLTVYPIGVERICHRWRADPGAARPDAPWIVPAAGQAPRYRLAEPPISIR